MSTAAATEAVPHLAPRHLQILGLLSKGKTRAEIAGTLLISEATVGKYIGDIFSRLGVRNRVEAVETGYRIGLLDSPEQEWRGELAELTDLVLRGDREQAQALAAGIKARMEASPEGWPRDQAARV